MRPLAAALAVFLVCSGCDLRNSVAQRPPGPSRVDVGPLVLSAWLPAGIDTFRFDAADQARLADLGLTQIEWLQRAERDGESAESLAMAFASRQGLGLPVYYEAPGYTPYDKLRNWATKTSPPDTFDVAVAARVAALSRRWAGEPGLAGYLVGHEDYRPAAYEALARTVAALRAADPQHPAYTVGAIDSYPQVERFLDAFFVEGGEPNVFQHEHYVFDAGAGDAADDLRGRLERLVAGYDRAARLLRDRHGRWHAIVQVHGETRDGAAFYRPPTPAQIAVQAGLALSRGASGIVYFLYSSGLELVRDGAGQVVQRRTYAGLVDADGAPTPRFAAVRVLNARLRRLSPVLADLRFRGGYPARRVPADEPVAAEAADLDLGFFGDDAGTTHVLVVNRRTDAQRRVELTCGNGGGVTDVETGETLPVADGTVALGLAPGGFRLLALTPTDGDR